MFNFTSFLPQKKGEPQVQCPSWEDLLAAALPPVVVPPIDPSYHPVLPTLPPPPPPPPLVAPSPIVSQGQGAVYNGIGLASGSVDPLQRPSAPVGGRSSTLPAIDYTTINPMFYINYASFEQSVPALPVFATAPPAALATNAWPDLALPGGAGESGQVGPQRLRRTQVRAARNEPYANAVPNGASTSVVQLPLLPHPIAEPENVVEQRRTGRKGEEYRCLCGKWVLVRRRTKHVALHGLTWPCRLCTILNPENDMQLSRKDALKRHIEQQHPDYEELLYLPLGLLEPGEETVDEDAIREAMQNMLESQQDSA